MNTFTIGFTQKPARRFFGLLQKAGVSRVIDVRLRNNSQLAGFAKRDDLEFFLRELIGVDYLHIPDLAPSETLLKRYRSQEISWQEYEDSFITLLAQRAVHEHLAREIFDRAALLCSENEPHHCHRRLVVAYLNEHWGQALAVKHLQ